MVLYKYCSPLQIFHMLTTIAQTQFGKSVMNLVRFVDLHSEVEMDDLSVYLKDFALRPDSFWSSPGESYTYSTRSGKKVIFTMNQMKTAVVGMFIDNNFFTCSVDFHSMSLVQCSYRLGNPERHYSESRTPDDFYSILETVIQASRINELSQLIDAIPATTSKF